MQSQPSGGGNRTHVGSKSDWAIQSGTGYPGLYSKTLSLKQERGRGRERDHTLRLILVSTHIYVSSHQIMTSEHTA